ncbi:MAG: alpha/beta fold hydrolase [Nitriliruptorales bacterium]
MLRRAATAERWLAGLRRVGPQQTAPLAPVVFLHGAGQDGEIWADVVPLVPRPVIVHDFPGHGGRFGAALDRVEDLAEDAIAHLPGGRRSVLVGHSLGAAVALEAALRRPESVSDVVAVCCELDHQPDRRAMAALEDGDFERFTELIQLGIVGLRPGMSDPNQPTGPETHTDRDHLPGPEARGRKAAEESARRLERLVRRTGLETTAADYRAASEHDLTGRLEGLSLPVTVLAGGSDVLVPPRRVAALAAELGVEAQVVPDASHQVPWEAPEAVAHAVERMRRSDAE